MKINDINKIQAINKYRQTEKKEQELKQKEAKKDQIIISNEAKALLQQTKGVEMTPNEKIVKLKEQWNNGTYQVDANKVAEKMLQTMFKE